MRKESNLLLAEKKIPSRKKFLRVLIFAIFPAIRKRKFPQIKITENIFPTKNLLQSKYSLT